MVLCILIELKFCCKLISITNRGWFSFKVQHLLSTIYFSLYDSDKVASWFSLYNDMGDKVASWFSLYNDVGDKVASFGLRPNRACGRWIYYVPGLCGFCQRVGYYSWSQTRPPAMIPRYLRSIVGRRVGGGEPGEGWSLDRKRRGEEDRDVGAKAARPLVPGSIWDLQN